MHASEKSAEVLTTTHRQPFPEAATSREGLSQSGPPLKHPGMEGKYPLSIPCAFRGVLVPNGAEFAENLGGALHAEAVRSTVLVGRELKTEIPAKMREVALLPPPTEH